MIMEKKPSSIHRKRVGGMSRRRLLRTLTACGFAAGTAAALTPEDINAAGSDQVPITIDTSGESVVMVDADWYDRVQEARKVFQKMKNEWLPEQADNNVRENRGRGKGKDKHDDVSGVWFSAGKGNDNPHVIVSIDQESESKDNTRGNIPERRQGVRIEVEEMNREKELAWDHNNCDDKEKSNTTEMPGGLQVRFQGRDGSGTLTPRVVDSSYDHIYSIATAAHVASVDGECGDDLLGLKAYHYGNYLGELVYVDHRHDIAIIHNDYNYDQPIPEVWNPSDHSEQWGPIKDSLSKDGVDYWENNGRKLWKYGKKTCFTGGTVDSRGKTERARVNSPCADYWYDCVRWGEFGSIERGDSGSITFGAHPDENTFLACNINSWRWSSWSDGEYSAGPAGYAWRDNHGYWWKEK